MEALPCHPLLFVSFLFFFCFFFVFFFFFFFFFCFFLFFFFFFFFFFFLDTHGALPYPKRKILDFETEHIGMAVPVLLVVGMTS